MKRLQRPIAEYAANLQRATGPSQRQMYRDALAIAVHQADAYDLVTPHLRPITCHLAAASARTFFLNLYESRKQGVATLKTEIKDLLDLDPFENAAASCQYCTGLAQPSELDHYLEKSLLPELALYGPNLVPCCPDCNRIRSSKGRGTFNKHRRRQVLHFYDDNIDSLPELLTATIEMTSGTPRARYSIAANPHPLRVTFARHFTTLDLRKRYAKDAAAQIRFMQVKARRTGTTKAKLAKSLRDEAYDINIAYGKNDHRATLFRAVAASLPALTWVVTP